MLLIIHCAMQNFNKESVQKFKKLLVDMFNVPVLIHIFEYGGFYFFKVTFYAYFMDIGDTGFLTPALKLMQFILRTCGVELVCKLPNRFEYYLSKTILITNIDGKWSEKNIKPNNFIQPEISQNCDYESICDSLSKIITTKGFDIDSILSDELRFTQFSDLENPAYFLHDLFKVKIPEIEIYFKESADYNCEEEPEFEIEVDLNPYDKALYDFSSCFNI